MNRIIYFLLLIVVVFTIPSCDPSNCAPNCEGGTATIIGKVMIDEVDDFSCEIARTVTGIETDVFLIYGDNPNEIYSSDFKTDFNGNYKFEFLKKGTYQIYAYSRCIACPDTCNQDYFPVFEQAEITENGETYNVPNDIVIKDKF